MTTLTGYSFGTGCQGVGFACGPLVFRRTLGRMADPGRAADARGHGLEGVSSWVGEWRRAR